MLIEPLRDDTIKAGDLTFHYVKWGAKGRPIVAIHGLTANAYCFQPLADGLSAEYQLYAYDLRGRGDSDKPEQGYSTPIHASDLALLIEALGLERPILVGHSLGALVALYFAAQHPASLSKLVLIDAGTPVPWDTPQEQPAWLTASINRLGTPVPSFAEYTQRLQAAPFLGPYWNEYFALYFEHDVHYNSVGSVVSKCYREGVLEEGRRYAEARPQDQWSHVEVPTLLLRAGQGLFYADDQLISLEAAAAAQREIKQCQFIDFPALNHYTILLGSDPGPVEAIRAFLAQA
jgi:pimeloyl-ACP methyl ester carboxylesterase